ncbi:hypothetical protein J6590_054781 [Homalodisca vitripennis]|nr:hypothetical protein J6590_054781 [Homalodisca vitripennis]
MATGGALEEDSGSLDTRETPAKMKTSGLCMKNGFPGDLRYAEDYQTSPESSEGRRPRGMSSDEEEDEISVGCPSPIPDRLADGYHSDEDSCPRRPESPLLSRTAYQEERSSGDEIEQSDERTSSLSSASTTIHCRRTSHTCSSEDDTEHREDEYFKPLKKLKMMQIDKVSYSINRAKSSKRIHRPHQSHSPKESTSTVRRQSLEDSSSNGVKSFSILDILNHRPSKGVRLEEPRDTVVPTRIVRPWDYGGLEDPSGSCLPPPAHRGLIPPPPPLLLERYHRVHQHLRPKSADFCSSYDTSTCSSSGRSSTGGSDCCTSPDILNCTVNSPGPAHQRRPPPQTQRKSGKQASSSPLDALFQMTSKTFEELNGEGGSGESLLSIGA